MTKPSFVRRKPQDDTPIEIPQSEQVCPNPICNHVRRDHNMFGCCNNDTTCACLLSPEMITMLNLVHQVEDTDGN